MAVNLISIANTLSKVRFDPIHSDDAMNVKINPEFFAKSNNNMDASSSSSNSPNVMLGLKNKTTTSKSSCNKEDTTKEDNQTTTIMLKPLSFHSHKELVLAERSIQKLVEDSHFFPPEAAREDWFHHTLHGGEITSITTLYESELQVGRMLGRGGFCQVRLVNLTNRCDGRDNTHEYALKYLQPSKKSKSSFARGAADLAIEARFLSLLSHEGIIKLHHVSAGTLAETYNCLELESIKDDDCFEDNEGQDELSPSLRTYGYFLVLDYLRDTLLQRIQNLYIPSMISHGLAHPKAHHNKHKCHYGQHHSSSDKYPKQEGQLHWWNKKLWQRNASDEERHTRKNSFVKDLLKKRLRILRQVASALEYLHSNGIVYRDLKPDNIGFYFPPDSLSRNGGFEGIPKLFDFGLVKELKPSLRKSQPIHHCSCTENQYTDEDTLFKLTGRTGSRRYMSPEVALYKPYNLKADVYSFGILLYETVTLVQPFDGYSLDKHETCVLKGGERPCLVGYSKSNACWPRDLKHLIEDCWADDMRKRPNMASVVRKLEKCLVEMDDSNGSYYDHSVNSSIYNCHNEEVYASMGRAKRKGLLSNITANFPSVA